MRIKLTVGNDNDGGIELYPEREAVSKTNRIKSLWRSASKQRLRRAMSCVLRGDFRYLWHQINKFSSVENLNNLRGIDLKYVLEILANKKEVVCKLDRRVDLVIPVYNGYDYLEALFSSIYRNTHSSYRLIVVDDASPDERVWPLLQSLVRIDSNAILLRNETNLGFVKTVNKATQYVEGDFALLNTDIELPALWLERLMAPICLDRSIASTTPFSNAATICSFPKMNIDNELPSDIEFHRIDACFGKLRADLSEVTAPTGVGFCMGVNGDIWKEIGMFDDELFSRGYGEENDWCQRAVSKGYRNLIVQNLFVYHKHGGSFDTETRAALRNENYRKLIKRWPNYPLDVDCFIDVDPLRASRSMAILLAYCNEGSKLPILIVDHEIGGGANTYRRKLVEDRLSHNEPIFVLTAPQFYGAKESQLILDFYYGKYRERFEVNNYDCLHELFSVVRLGEIFFNNIVSYKNPLAVVRMMLALKIETKARLVLALHDFYMINPSYTLLNAEGVYTGLSQIEKSWIDIHKNPYAYNPQNNSMEEWHTSWGGLVATADEILCFSENSKKHLVSVYPKCASIVSVRPHTLPIEFNEKPQVDKSKHLNVAVVGNIGKAKGCEIVVELTKLLAKHDKHSKLTVVGMLELARSRSNLLITGPYKAENLSSILEEYNINVCLLPSIWPETFSYVAEELMALDMPVVCFDIGAPAERLALYKKGEVANQISAESALAAIIRLVERLEGEDSKS